MYVGLRCAPRGRAPVSRPAPQPCASLPPLGGRLRPPHPLSAALGRHPRRPFSAPRSPRPPLGRPVRPPFGGGPCRCGGRPPTDPSVAGCLVAVLLCARAGFGLLSVSFRLMGWLWVRAGMAPAPAIHDGRLAPVSAGHWEWSLNGFFCYIEKCLYLCSRLFNQFKIQKLWLLLIQWVLVRLAAPWVM